MTRVKICGITTPDDGVMICHEGSDAMGLNFIKQSPRCISVSTALSIRAEMTPFTALVGLFNGSRESDQFPETVDKFHFNAVQLYAASHDFRHYNAFKYILPYRIRDRKDLDRCHALLAEVRGNIGDPPDAILLDSHSDHALGGTGRTAPWDLLAGFDPGVPVILAGGLTPENVAEAIRIVKPWGVDVASGVECKVGVKDRYKVRDFIQAARATG